MAYPFYPTGYQPYQMPGTQMSLANQQNNAYQNATGSPIWVQGENAAKSYPVQAGSSVVLFDSEADTIYIKSADMAGMPSIKILDYKIRDASQTDNRQAQMAFATKDEVTHLQEEIASLKSKLEAFTRKEKKDGK